MAGERPRLLGPSFVILERIKGVGTYLHLDQDLLSPAASRPLGSAGRGAHLAGTQPLWEKPKDALRDIET